MQKLDIQLHYSETQMMDLQGTVINTHLEVRLTPPLFLRILIFNYNPVIGANVARKFNTLFCHQSLLVPVYSS